MDINRQPKNRTQPEEPLGDVGHGRKTWTPESGEQGISNRPDDQGDGVPDGDEEDDDAAFNGDDDDEDDVDDDVEDESAKTEKP